MDIEKILIAILLTPAAMLIIPFLLFYLLAMWPAFLIAFSLQLALENIDTLAKVVFVGIFFYSIYFVLEAAQSYINNKYKGEK